ncbi:decarboxylating 6-phosphogluconate dehydrogenase [Endothiovibrio diazotrophicus]
MIGLGRMGGNMARRLARAGIEVVGFNRSHEAAEKLAAEEPNATAVPTLEAAVAALDAPRVVWLMLPAGAPTEETLNRLGELLAPGDVVVDGGNANYHDSQRRGALLAEKGIGFADAGTSGGVWGLENGYCMMVGATAETFAAIEPAIRALAPGEDRGWAHVGPVGAGHFTKMVHNGIEYGMMQSLAEGLALLEGKQEFDLDLAEVSEIWRHGSVVRSWLLDLTAEALKEDQKLEAIAPYVADSGEGRWTAMEAIDQGIAAPVMTLALQMRFASQDERGYTNRLLAAMRNAFGGHAIKKSG